MKRIRISKHKSLILLGLLTVNPILAQQKLDEKFNVKEDVVINLNTSHTNVVFETWNKDVVAVEAHVEGEGLTKTQREYVNDHWQVTATGNSEDITIISNTAKNVQNPNSNSVTVNLQGNLLDLQMLGPMITGMLEPLLQNIAQNPIPNEMKNNMGDLDFDYASYQKNGEKYMKKWESNLREKFGDDFEVVMEEWGKRMEKDAIRFSENLDSEMQLWAQQFERDMQQWSYQFEQQMGTLVSQNVVTGNNSPRGYMYEVKDPNTTSKKVGVRKLLKIRIPKTAQLKLNIRHGEVTLADNAINLRASLSHTKLAANTIDGKDTRIKASYSPVIVKNWNRGVLIVDYVKNCRIENAKDIRLKTNSSNVYIQNLNTNGLISGNFGSITIANMSSDFSSLNLSLQNSDLKLVLPKSGFNFTYLGSRNLIELPSSLDWQRTHNFGTESITGFNKTRNTNKSITINAEYSDLKLQ